MTKTTEFDMVLDMKSPASKKGNSTATFCRKSPPFFNPRCKDLLEPLRRDRSRERKSSSFAACFDGEGLVTPKYQLFEGALEKLTVSSNLKIDNLQNI